MEPFRPSRVLPKLAAAFYLHAKGPPGRMPDFRDMLHPLSRRRLLQWGAASPLLLTPFDGLAADHFADTGLHFGPPQPFSFAALAARAEAMAAADYQPPYRPAPELVAQIDYDAHGKIRFAPERALFGPRSEGMRSAYPATFFHLGKLFGKSVKMHAVAGGAAREVLYSPSYFSMPAD